MLSQRDRLGGAPLMWSRLGAYGIGENHPATTRPVKHYGRYFDRTMKVEDSVYALCPPKNQIKPSNIFVIELFHLAGRSNPTDRVVAWTALPISNTHFTVVNGKFRLPMLRGELSPSIKHFRSMEALMADDLNAWLCNIYVEVKSHISFLHLVFLLCRICLMWLDTTYSPHDGCGRHARCQGELFFGWACGVLAYAVAHHVSSAYSYSYSTSDEVLLMFLSFFRRNTKSSLTSWVSC